MPDAPPVSALDIRMFLLDRFPADNYLLDDVEFDNEALTSAMRLCIDKYNSTNPRVDCYQLDNFPWRYELIIGTAGLMLKSGSFNMARNQLKYTQADGTAVDDKSNADLYFKMGDILSREFDERVSKIKTATNLSQGYGHISGPFPMYGG